MKHIFFIILCVNIFINTFAQNQCENMIKYWHYRNRLKYFVIPGTKQGESEMIGIRNRMDYFDYNPAPPFKYKNSSPYQHGVIFGYYLSMLATEYKLLSDNGQTNSATKTKHELELALNQFRTYMDSYAEGYWGYPLSENGFFVRDNFPCNFLDTLVTIDSAGYTVNGERHLDLLNKNLTPNNVWDDTSNTFHGLPPGHPGYTDNIASTMCRYPTDPDTIKDALSQDEAVGILQGLALTKKLCPDLATTSEDIACRIFTYMRNEFPDPGGLMWQMYLPDGSPILGGLWGTFLFGNGDAGRYAYGYYKASKYIKSNCIIDYHDPEYAPNALTGVTDELLWQSEGWLHNPEALFNDYMKATIAAIGRSWFYEIHIVLGFCPIFCYQTVIRIPATPNKIHHVTSNFNNETFYLLLYDVLHSKNTILLSRYKAESQINSAPCEGPYNYGDGIHPDNDSWGGWSSPYRWRNDFYDQHGEDHGDGAAYKGNFNGLDYMLFYNLYHIINGGISYENYNNRYLIGTVGSPMRFVAFDSIYSIQTINQTQPLVEYKAGKQIELKPNFHAMPGSDFHAYIGPTECGENFITDTTYHVSPDTLTGEEGIEFTIPCDSMVANGVSDTSLVHFNGLDFDSTGVFNYHWEFDPGSGSNPQTSDIINPAVYFPCGNCYKITLILSKDSTDTTVAISDTIEFSLCKPCCDSLGGKKLSYSKNTHLTDHYQVLIYPNPTTGVFNVSCSDNSLSYSMEVSDVVGNKVYDMKNINGMMQFDLTRYPKGIYFVKVITSDNKTHYKKIVFN